MKKPEKVKLGWKEFSVVYKQHAISDEGKDCYGLASYQKGEIFISEDKCTEATQKIDGLLHELLHMIDKHYMTELSENQISMLACGLGDLAAQNPELMKYIFEEGWYAIEAKEPGGKRDVKKKRGK